MGKVSRMTAMPHCALISKTMAADSVRQIEILLCAEDITVQCGKNDEISIVEYSDRRGVDEKYTANIEKTGEKVTVSSRPRGLGWIGLQWAFLPRMRLEVTVPERYAGSIRASTMSGDVDAGNVEVLELSLDSKSGDVYSDGTSASVFTATAISGDVRVSSLAADTADLSTVSGDVTAVFSKVREVKAKSTSGDISVSIEEIAGSGSVRAKTVSGDVMIALPTGISVDVDLQTISGRTRMLPDGYGELKIAGDGIPVIASTTSGDISITACTAHTVTQTGTASGGAEERPAVSLEK